MSASENKLGYFQRRSRQLPFRAIVSRMFIRSPSVAVAINWTSPFHHHLNDLFFHSFYIYKNVSALTAFGLGFSALQYTIAASTWSIAAHVQSLISRSKPVIAVVFYSTYGHITSLAEAIIKGAQSTGAVVKPYCM